MTKTRYERHIVAQSHLCHTTQGSRNGLLCVVYRRTNEPSNAAKPLEYEGALDRRLTKALHLLNYLNTLEYTCSTGYRLLSGGGVCSCQPERRQCVTDNSLLKRVRWMVRPIRVRRWRRPSASKWRRWTPAALSITVPRSTTALDHLPRAAQLPWWASAARRYRS